MFTQEELDEYMAEIRERVCSGCYDRPLGGPPCGPLGKSCGVELHLAEIVEMCHRSQSKVIDPYIESFHNDVCSHCESRTTNQCPCPLDPLLLLAVEAIEAVDERKQKLTLGRETAADC